MFAEVQSIETLSPDLVRIVLGGGTLHEFEGSPATDAYINARFIPAGSPLVVPFDTDDLDSISPEHRPKPRRFTIRRWNPTNLTLAIDFVVHGEAGYAGTWAQHAVPGDRLQFEGPGGSYQPSSDADWHLMVGDESAFGAIGASLESLSPDAQAVVFALVERPGHEIDLPSAAEVDVTWLYREGVAQPDSVLVDAVAAAEFPVGSFDTFVHGEAGETRTIRNHLAEERDVDLSTASISPYWRRNHDDEAWRKVKRDFMSASPALADSATSTH